MRSQTGGGNGLGTRLACYNHKSLQSGSHTLGLGMRLHICLACCLPSLNSGVETLPSPLPHPGSPADRLQTDVERPTTSAIRSFPPLIRWDSVPILQPCVPIPFCKLEEGVVYELAPVGCSKGTVVFRAMEGCEVCSIFYYVYTPYSTRYYSHARPEGSVTKEISYTVPN